MPINNFLDSSYIRMAYQFRAKKKKKKRIKQTSLKCHEFLKKLEEQKEKEKMMK